MSATLAELLQPQTVTQIFNQLLAAYQRNGFPTDSWQPFGTERTRLMAMATVLTDVSANYVPNITAGGFLDYAALLDSPDWLQLLAAQMYNIQFNDAQFASGTMHLATVSGAGPYTIGAGGLIAVFQLSSRRWVNTSSVTIPAGVGSVNATFHAEFSGSSYNSDASNSTITLATPLPGVTVTNPGTTFSPNGAAAHVGAGTGTVTPSGTPSISGAVVIRIDIGGAAGTASWSYSISGGAYVSAGAVSSAANIGGSGITITLAGALATSFIAGDSYSFNTPGSWLTALGADVESNPALQLRCQNRWSSLSPIPTIDFYELLVTSTPGVGSQVTQVIAVNDPVINNQTNIIVIGPPGSPVLPAATIVAIQNYVNPRVPTTFKPVVGSPTGQNITIAATITVQAALFTSASNAITTSLTNYVLGVGINGTVRIAQIIDLVMNVTGSIDIIGVTINGVASNLTLGPSGTPTATFGVALSPTLSLSVLSQ